MEGFANDPENVNDSGVEAISHEMVEFDEECPPQETQLGAIEEEQMMVSNHEENSWTRESSSNLKIFFNATIRKLIQLIFLTILPLSIALFHFVWPRNYGKEQNTALIYDGHHRKTFNGKPAYQVLLTGDSLNLRPWQYHNLGGRIQNHLPTIALFFNQQSLSSYTMAKLNKAIRKQIRSQPDFVFICGDTDVSTSGNDEYKMTPKQIEQVHSQYKANMTDIINQLQSTVPFVAFSGPFLLGEHRVEPVFYGLTAQGIFNHKRKQLGEYVEMNAEVCAASGVKYINLHKLFSHQLPPMWPFATWYVTFDGEHPNQYGASLMAREYALAIKEWLKLPDSAWRD